MKRLIVILLLVLLHGEFSNAQEAPLAPFVYYYSIEKQAFVIERADGSDSQILTPYELPKESVVTSGGAGYLNGPGWSTSGNWFAWTYLLQNGIPSLNAYIVKRDGSMLRHLIGNLVVVSMKWQPHGDYLLLHLRSQVDIDNGEEIIRVYDPNVNKVVLDAKATEIMGSNRTIREVNWSPDGNYITIANADIIKLVDLSGKDIVSANQIPESNICASGISVQWLDDQRLIYVNPTTQQFIVEDTVSRKQVNTIPLPEGKIQLFDWSPDRTHALIYVENSSDSSIHSLWLLSPESASVYLIFNKVQLQNSCNPKPTAWGNNQQAAFVSNEGELHIFSVLTDNTKRVSVPIPGRVDALSPIRWIDNDAIFLWNVAEGKQVYKYEFQTKKTTLLVPSNPSEIVQTEFISEPHESKFIYNGNIVNVADGSQLEILRLGEEFGGLTFSTKDVVWHPSEDWVIALSGDSIQELLDVYVAETDGRIQRQISICLDQALSCYGWLPNVTDSKS